MITKRLLGIGFILAGVAAVAGIFGMDLLGAGQSQGIGPLQRQALLAAGLVILVGLTLLPLGNKPA